MKGQPISRQRWQKAKKSSQRQARASTRMEGLHLREIWPTFRMGQRVPIRPLVLNQIRKMMIGEGAKPAKRKERIEYLRKELEKGNVTVKDLVEMKFKFAPLGSLTMWDAHEKMMEMDDLIEAASGKKISPKYKTPRIRNESNFLIQYGRNETISRKHLEPEFSENPNRLPRKRKISNR